MHFQWRYFTTAVQVNVLWMEEFQCNKSTCVCVSERGSWISHRAHALTKRKLNHTRIRSHTHALTQPQTVRTTQFPSWRFSCCEHRFIILPEFSFAEQSCFKANGKKRMWILQNEWSLHRFVITRHSNCTQSLRPQANSSQTYAHNHLFLYWTHSYFISYTCLLAPIRQSYGRQSMHLGTGKTIWSSKQASELEMRHGGWIFKELPICCKTIYSVYREKRENIASGATKPLEENSQTGNRNSNNNLVVQRSVSEPHVKPWSRWAPAAQDHSSQLTGNRGYRSHRHQNNRKLEHRCHSFSTAVVGVEKYKSAAPASCQYASMDQNHLCSILLNLHHKE